MPQMSPMNWLFLFLYFNMGLFFLVVKLFYFSNKSVFNQGDTMAVRSNLFFCFLL